MAEGINFEAPLLFESEEERVASERVLRLLLDALLEEDERVLRAHPEFPNLYESGVRYQTEPAGVESFSSIPVVLERLHGDCADLASYRAAELRVRAGIAARTVYKFQRRPDGSLLYHILVQFPDGRIEDPSANLGMGMEDEGRPLIEFASPSRARRMRG